MPADDGQLVAPFVPFLAETLWQNLAGVFRRESGSGAGSRESVHLCDYPAGDAASSTRPSRPG